MGKEKMESQSDSVRNLLRLYVKYTENEVCEYNWSIF